MYEGGSIAHPCHVPQGPSIDLFAHVRAVLEAHLEPIVAALGALVAERTGAALLRVEEELQRMLCRVGGHVVGGVVAWMLADGAFVAAATAAVRAVDARPLRHRGSRRTVVRFLGGVRLALTVRYLSTDRSDAPGRRRRVGRRGEKGGGCYPALERLGIRERTSPALAGEVARQAVRCSSFEEAAEALGERGVAIDATGVKRLVGVVGDEALRQRDLRLAAALEGRVLSDELAGKRIVVSIDGGRLRTRKYRRRARGKNGGRRFEAPWREPKLVVVYVIDDKGRKVRSLRPLYEGTLGDADAVFELVVAELLLRGAARAEEIVVVADGALWIWNRVAELPTALGLAPEKVVPVADFYHAVEHLTDFAELCSGWTEKGRAKWLKQMRRRLERGHVDAVVEGLRKLCTGRNAKKLSTQAAYFAERRELMRYDRFLAAGMPIGSGAIESAVRRVVNLRLKGPGMFWTERTAEAMVHLRAYLKAGRWDELMQRVVHRTPDGAPNAVSAVAA
jgi:hypothetical protein